jgi:HEPN domain-containing protein
MNGKLVKEWVSKAEQDYAVAKVLLQRRALRVNDAICFHSQQCIEKYLKAFLTSNSLHFPKSHSLENLTTLASKQDGSYELIADLIRPLSKYAVGFRYPGEEARRPEARYAVKTMEEARKFIRERLNL